MLPFLSNNPECPYLQTVHWLLQEPLWSVSHLSLVHSPVYFLRMEEGLKFLSYWPMEQTKKITLFCNLLKPEQRVGVKLQVLFGDSGKSWLTDIQIIPSARTSNFIRITMIFISKEGGVCYSSSKDYFCLEVSCLAICPWTSYTLNSQYFVPFPFSMHYTLF